MLLINNFKCRLCSLNPEYPSKGPPNLLEYHVRVDAPTQYHHATCWIPVEQIFAISSCDQEPRPLPIRIQVSHIDPDHSSYDVHIFHNGSEVYPSCVWPPPLQQLVAVRPETEGIGQGDCTWSSTGHLSPSAWFNCPAYTKGLIKLTSPEATSRMPLLFYAPGFFHGGTLADAAEVPPRLRPFAPKVSSSLKNEISKSSLPNGVFTVIITVPGARPILPNQGDGHNLATFSFCYVPKEELSKFQK